MATDDDLEFEKLLNEFISSQLEDVDIEENTPSKTPQSNKKNDNIQHSQSQDDDEVSPEDKEFDILKDNEKSLMKAYRNFGDALDLLASDFQLNSPKFELSVTMLYPNYKPSVGKIIANDTLAGWDIILKSHPELKGVIHPHATDEEMLNIAEKSDDDALQFALISYVELLIELEGCEISYKERKLKHEKRKLEREIYEEHQKRIARINRYIEALKEENKHKLDELSKRREELTKAHNEFDDALSAFKNTFEVFFEDAKNQLEEKLASQQRQLAEIDMLDQNINPLFISKE